MKVSAILPNYNYARYLKERIRSILNQTERDLELLYLDDASTDDSNRVAAGFASDPRMSMHLFERNSGSVYPRWNEGAAQARGDWLWFPGADDSAHPQFLARLLELAARHPDAGILRSDFLRVSTEGRILGRSSDDAIRRPRDATDYYAESGPAEICYAALSTYATASSLLIRRDLFEACGGFDTRVRLAADTLLYLTAVSRAGVAYTAEPLTVYRDHAVTVTRTSSMTATDFCKCYVMARAIQIFDEQGLEAAGERRLLRRFIRFRLNTILCTPEAAIPADLEWMTPAIRHVVPDSPLFRRAPGARPA